MPCPTCLQRHPDTPLPQWPNHSLHGTARLLLIEVRFSCTLLELLLRIDATGTFTPNPDFVITSKPTTRTYHFTVGTAIGGMILFVQNPL